MDNELSTHEGILSAIDRVNNNPRGWNSREGRLVLAHAETALIPIARHERMEPADAVHAAWLCWQGPAVFAADDVWAWTHTSVKNSLQRQKHAQSSLTSENGLKRQGMDDLIGFADQGLEATATIPAPQHINTRSTPEFATAAFRHAEQLLAEAGHTVETARTVLESIARLASTCTTPRSAYDAVTREAGVPRALGLDVKVWRDVCALLLGNSAGDMGLVAAELAGVAPESVKNIRNAGGRILRAA